jgi:hypothetical protein
VVGHDQANSLLGQVFPASEDDMRDAFEKLFHVRHQGQLTNQRLGSTWKHCQVLYRLLIGPFVSPPFRNTTPLPNLSGTMRMQVIGDQRGT